MSRLVWLVLVAALVPLARSAVAASPSEERTAAMPAPVATPFGTLPDGRAVNLWTLEVPGGWKATISEYGAILTSLHVPSAGGPVDVVLGFDSLDPYVKGHPYFGATCGRVSNRIAKGSFELDGRTHTLATNNGANHLHGGVTGFDKHLWKATPHATSSGPALELVTVSPDGEEGYPGRLAAKVVYTLTPAGELMVDMSATTDAPTIVNMVHHSYWNMAGQRSGPVAAQELTVFADAYLPVDGGGIPTGEQARVEGSPFDFRPERRPAGTIGAAIAALPKSADGTNPGGVDHNYCIRGWKPDGVLRPVAVLRDPASGRRMEIVSDQPGVQVYTGNYLDGSLTGKGGAVYGKHGGICLETQKYPDSIHHADWPSTRLDPGQTYRHRMIHRFMK
ncbi:MAG: aldose epimerase family protein [Planctomycetaceae bacterium]